MPHDPPINLDDPPTRWHVLTGHMQTLITSVAVINERMKQQAENESSIRHSIERVVGSVHELTQGQTRLEGRLNTMEDRFGLVQKVVFFIVAAACIAVVTAILRTIGLNGLP